MPSRADIRKRKRKNTIKKIGAGASTVASGVSNYLAGNYTGLVNDVKRLKELVNAEKKICTQLNTGINFGQVNANTNGFYVWDATPVMAQGTTSITRNGNSIKPHSAFYRFQFYQQSSCQSPVKVKVVVMEVMGTPNASVGTYPTVVLDPNPFIAGGTIYDYNSNFSNDYFRTFRILASKTVKMEMDYVTGALNIKELKFGLKFRKGYHVKFNADGSNVVASGQIIIMILADTGNCSTTTNTTTLNGPISTAMNTGLSFNSNLIYYYYDN